MKLWYQSYIDAENENGYWAAMKAHIDAVVDPGTEVVIHGITPYDSYAHPLMEWRCSREMICNAVRAEREGYDGFINGHFQDGGVYEARSAVDIPVVTLGEASMLYACQLGQRIGIVTINPRFIPWFHHQIAKYGLGERVTGVHAMTFEPGQIMASLGKPEFLAEVRDQFEAQAAPLVRDGVDVLLPGGGIPMVLFSQIHDHRVDGAPVINGISILIKLAETAVKLKRLTGLGVSRVGDYAKAPDWVIDEFMTNPKGL